MSTRPSVLLVTDPSYDAAGRAYGDEDLDLAARLRARFDVETCDPREAADRTAGADVVVVRNSGPVLGYADAWDDFRRRALATGARVFTELSGKADQRGKGYLLDLAAEGFPVIPTVTGRAELDRLPDVDTYVVKPVLGADSVGLQVVDRAGLARLDLHDQLVQPRIDFVHEVSFYFVDRTFHYALHAPDPDRRWELEPWEVTAADLAFAQRFVDWNDVDHGIQRVDACRTRDGGLLLVELEDLNPFLSLDRVSPAVRDRFVAAMASSIAALAAT